MVSDSRSVYRSEIKIRMVERRGFYGDDQEKTKDKKVEARRLGGGGG